MKGGPAKLYPSVREMIEVGTPYLDWILEHDFAEDGWPEFQTETRKFKTNLSTLDSWFLAHLHNTARPGETPDLMQLNKAYQLFQDDLRNTIALVEAAKREGFD